MASLEEMYNSAGAESYVGRVRELQAADRGAGRGVNFLDGEGVGKWTPGRTDSPDQFQKEFTRNNEGDHRYGGGGKVPGTYALTRWLEKSLKLAFDGVGPATRPQGYWQDSRFTLLNDPRNMNRKIHEFAPLPDRTLLDKSSTFTQARIKGSAMGPTPGGLNG